MKKLIVMTVAAVCAATVFAETAAAPDKPQRRRRESRPSGGLLERKEAVPSKPVAIVDSQKVLAKEKVADLVKKARIASNLPYELDAKGAPATIELVECDKTDALAIFPESFKASINLKALAADGAAPDVIEARVSKELVRAGLFLMGSGYATYNCFATPVTSLAELDALTAQSPTPETMLHLRGMRKVGVKEIRFATYRQACQEGWAPKPDNDVRQKIWDEIHTIPDKPLKIEFDPKTDTK